MTPAQLGFLAGMTVVTLAVLGFVVVVLLGARATDGGSYLSVPMLRRLARSSTARAEANRWAFYAHRISGFAVFAFLALHILDVALYALSPAVFDEVHQLYGTAPMRVFECGLLLALLFHAFNGLRLIAVDLWDLGPVWAARLLGVTTVSSLVLTALGSAVILLPLVT